MLCTYLVLVALFFTTLVCGFYIKNSLTQFATKSLVLHLTSKLRFLTPISFLMHVRLLKTMQIMS